MRSKKKYMATSRDTRQYLQHEASHKKKAYTTKRHLHPLGVETRDRHTHVCKLKKSLYELIRHPWDSTESYMRRLNITQSDEDINLCYNVEYESLQRMKSSQMGAKGTFQQSSRKRILISSAIRQIHRRSISQESTCYSST